MMLSHFSAISEIYRGPLLPRASGQIWLNPAVRYYQSLYLRVLKGYILRKLHIDDPLRAQKAVKEGLSIEPNDSDLHFMMAYFLARHGNLAAAQNYVSANREYILPEHRVAIQQAFDGKPMNEADLKDLMHF